jgi:stalled ribosome rescue protein Dom34
LILSPGTLNDDFLRYLADRSVREEDTAIIKNKSKFLRAATTTGTRKAIEEMLSSPDLLRQLTNVKAADEVHIVLEFSFLSC